MPLWLLRYSKIVACQIWGEIKVKGDLLFTQVLAVGGMLLSLSEATKPAVRCYVTESLVHGQCNITVTFQAVEHNHCPLGVSLSAENGLTLTFPISLEVIFPGWSLLTNFGKNIPSYWVAVAVQNSYNEVLSNILWHLVLFTGI